MTNFKTFFISDLHLSKNTPNVALLFQYFVSNIMKPGDTLVILGDFFEYYLGDDLIDSVQEGALMKLKRLQEQGSKIFFMPGNRDFLIKKNALTPYKIELLIDPCLFKIFGKRILLVHGDHLCTKDIKYQHYRKLSHHFFIKWLFLHLPKKIRIQIAETIHSKNPHSGLIKDPQYDLADATPDAINREIKKYQPDLFIYGHVHKMTTQLHETTLRMVLGDWHRTGNYIELSETKAEAKIFSLNG